MTKPESPFWNSTFSVTYSTDEVKEIRNQSEALRAYALQAKNRQLEIDAGEIRLRAERRLGELIRAQKESTGLNRGQLLRGTRKEPREEKPTLSEVGISKKLSARSQQLAAIPDGQFESMLGDWRSRVERETERVTVNLLKESERQQRKESARESEPPIGKYSTIVIDPPCTHGWVRAISYRDVRSVAADCC